MHLLSEMHDEFERSPDDSEVILKTQKDFWIVGRKVKTAAQTLKPSLDSFFLGHPV